MASPKVEKISEPEVKLSDTDELNAALRRLGAYLRKMDRFKNTLDRRKSSATKKYDDSTKPIIAELEPLIDQVFWHAYIHWKELTTGRATESVKLIEAEFKRHIDTVGTLLLNEERAVKYLQNIESSDFALKLKQDVGEEAAQAILDRMKSLVTVRQVAEIDKAKLKSLLADSPSALVDGAELKYTNRLTLIPAQSRSQKLHDQKPTTIVRQIP